MYKFIIIGVLLQLVQANQYVRVVLNKPVTVENEQFIVPFNQVKVEVGGTYNRSAYKVNVMQSGTFYVESHVVIESDYSPVIEIMKESGKNHSVVDVCDKLINKRCTLDKRIPVVNGDKIYVRVNAHTNSSTTVLQSDTYLFVASI